MTLRWRWPVIATSVVALLTFSFVAPEFSGSPIAVTPLAITSSSPSSLVSVPLAPLPSPLPSAFPNVTATSIASIAEKRRDITVMWDPLSNRSWLDDRMGYPHIRPRLQFYADRLFAAPFRAAENQDVSMGFDTASVNFGSVYPGDEDAQVDEVGILFPVQCHSVNLAFGYAENYQMEQVSPLLFSFLRTAGACDELVLFVDTNAFRQGVNAVRMLKDQKQRLEAETEYVRMMQRWRSDRTRTVVRNATLDALTFVESLRNALHRRLNFPHDSPWSHLTWLDAFLLPFAEPAIVLGDVRPLGTSIGVGAWMSAKNQRSSGWVVKGPTITLVDLGNTKGTLAHSHRVGVIRRFVDWRLQVQSIGVQLARSATVERRIAPLGMVVSVDVRDMVFQTNFFSALTRTLLDDAKTKNNERPTAFRRGRVFPRASEVTVITHDGNIDHNNNKSLEPGNDETSFIDAYSNAQSANTLFANGSRVHKATSLNSLPEMHLAPTMGCVMEAIGLGIEYWNRGWFLQLTKADENDVDWVWKFPINGRDVTALNSGLLFATHATVLRDYYGEMQAALSRGTVTLGLDQGAHTLLFLWIAAMTAFPHRIVSVDTRFTLLGRHGFRKDVIADVPAVVRVIRDRRATNTFSLGRLRNITNARTERVTDGNVLRSELCSNVPFVNHLGEPYSLVHQLDRFPHLEARCFHAASSTGHAARASDFNGRIDLPHRERVSAALNTIKALSADAFVRDWEKNVLDNATFSLRLEIELLAATSEESGGPVRAVRKAFESFRERGSDLEDAVAPVWPGRLKLADPSTDVMVLSHETLPAVFASHFPEKPSSAVTDLKWDDQMGVAAAAFVAKAPFALCYCDYRFAGGCGLVLHGVDVETNQDAHLLVIPSSEHDPADNVSLTRLNDVWVPQLAKTISSCEGRIPFTVAVATTVRHTARHRPTRETPTRFVINQITQRRVTTWRPTHGLLEPNGPAWLGWMLEAAMRRLREVVNATKSATNAAWLKRSNASSWESIYHTTTSTDAIKLPSSSVRVVIDDAAYSEDILKTVFPSFEGSNVKHARPHTKATAWHHVSHWQFGRPSFTEAASGWYAAFRRRKQRAQEENKKPVGTVLLSRGAWWRPREGTRRAEGLPLAFEFDLRSIFGDGNVSLVDARHPPWTIVRGETALPHHVHPFAVVITSGEGIALRVLPTLRSGTTAITYCAGEGEEAWIERVRQLHRIMINVGSTMASMTRWIVVLHEGGAFDGNASIVTEGRQEAMTFLASMLRRDVTWRWNRLHQLMTERVVDDTRPEVLLVSVNANRAAVLDFSNDLTIQDHSADRFFEPQWD